MSGTAAAFVLVIMVGFGGDSTYPQIHMVPMYDRKTCQAARQDALLNLQVEGIFRAAWLKAVCLETGFASRK